MPKYTVFIPVIHSEWFPNVTADSPEEALELVKNGEVECKGTFITSKESQGVRVVEEEES